MAHRLHPDRESGRRQVDRLHGALDSWDAVPTARGATDAFRVGEYQISTR
ncbi:hypothetical protein ABZ471_36245 [Streptomyces sp. NPDC005728]